MNLIELEPLLPEAIFDLRYATDNNIVGTVLYQNGDHRARLNRPAAYSLLRAAQVFMESETRLVIWDTYRPITVQKSLLAVNSDPRYVLDADTSNHTKGLAVDVTLADKQGNYLDMGTDFDDFTPLAHANAGGLNPQQEAGRSLLKSVMEAAGFKQWPYEWWHFDFDGPDLS